MKITYYQHEIEVPDWANWICTNKDGQVWVFENKPVIEVNYWFKADGQRERAITVVPLDWKNSLIQIQKAHVEPEQLTLRDQFAMAALSGELASQGGDAGYYSERSFKLLAENSYKIADAMVEARAR